ncbi:baseplate J/gp47 family protein [Serratia marcescens]|uniref:baseplate J/gp47 family protein n=1 Tax=Serratia marcescens TaxID=615 RepID=UPI001EF0A8D4|nr:baseplate J/gp47 family protein [Serratia marcescens]ULH10798.1 baseplate J/gp47 family protein [Serratia marcescens]ULH12276.1 baseplate J/gp47 family protein [Serratia marcescens]
MPFQRPTLSELRQRNVGYMQSELRGVGSLLRFANLRIIGNADAGMAHLHYGYLDYIALQATPYTATDEWLAGWAALKGVFRKPATAATCPEVSFTGTAGRSIPAGSRLNRSDGYTYQLDNAVTLGQDGTGKGSITAVLPDPSSDPTGGGAAGNAEAGTLLTLDVAIAGVQSQVTAVQAIIGGADIELQEDFRARMLLAYQETAQGGNDEDYEGWALEVPGITRAWVVRRLMGAGTVGIYIMCDGVSGHPDGFPVGTNGVSHLEPENSQVATGDQGRVADHLYSEHNVTAEVWVCSPIKHPVNFTISGIKAAGAATKAAIDDAIDKVLFSEGRPGVKPAVDTPPVEIDLSSIELAIANVPGTKGFLLTQPTGNILLDVGELALRGTVTYT